MFRSDWIAADPVREVLSAGLETAAFEAAGFRVCGLSEPGRAKMRQEVRISTPTAERHKRLQRVGFMPSLYKRKGLEARARGHCYSFVGERPAPRRWDFQRRPWRQRYDARVRQPLGGTDAYLILMKMQ